jgi:hypothetical protein
LNESKELEGLKNKRTQLEEESRSLEEQQKILEERLTIAEEKLAIQELEDNNRTRLEAVKNLESKIGELEKRLKKALKEPEAFVSKEEPKEQPTPEVTEAAPEEIVEGGVEVTAIEEPAVSPQAEQLEEDQRRQRERRKRKFF